MLQVDVIYPQNDHPSHLGEHVARLFYPADSYLPAVLDCVWRTMNSVEEGDLPTLHQHRSMMVGDVIVTQLINVQSKRYFICDNVGWKEVDEETSRQWCELDRLDRTLGTDWIKKKNLLPAIENAQPV